MNECGVWSRFLPEFCNIVAMMQMYHYYDEPLLRSIGMLSQLEHGEDYEKHPLANQIMTPPQDRTVFYVALIAKGKAVDHSIARAEHHLFPSLGFQQSQTELVACWLVGNHLSSNLQK
ncbi:hypothetical protein [Candidatus Endowatersipora endosymbiont of Watersipora subatra]|uniref:hypothetical protein n=1 Tax=Candidatus Endowatersipora endosymbiont of Watersipora subatra TaxID=3077946 RepID=UPI00312CC1C6